MANYGLAANTVFRNRSFEDLLKPLAMYTEEYNAQENALNELETKANVWENMANEETDPIAYAQYKRYADTLRNQAVALANNGLTPSTRRDILNLRKMYASEIVPIEQAFANRKQQADEQRKALLQNPTLLLSRRADMTSLDDYLANPELGYNQYSGALLTSQVGTAAQALAKELQNYGNGKPLDKYTKLWIQQHGFTAGEVAEAINNPNSPNSNKVLKALVDNVIADSGIPQWADRNTLNQAYAYARQGLWQAVGQTTVTPYADQGAIIEAKKNADLEVARARLRGDGDDLRDPRSIIRHWSMDVETASKYLPRAKELYSKMMNKDGKLTTTYAGKNGYVNPLKIYDEYMKEAAKTVKTSTRYNPRTGEYYEARSSSNFEAAADAIKKRYGVNRILNEQEYNTLKSLGYTNDSSLKDFNDGFLTRINRAGTSYSASSTNMSDYSHVQDVVYPTMRRFYNNGNNPGFLYEYTPNGRGSAVSFDDAVSFDNKGKPDYNIEDVSYSVKSPDDLIFTIGGKDYYMSPEGYGADLYNIINGYKRRFWDYLDTDEDKSEFQDMVTLAVRNELDRFNKVRSKTDSNR